MIKLKIHIYAIVALLILLVACSPRNTEDVSGEGDKPVVKVFDKTLLQSDVAKMIPDGLSRPDSVRSAEVFVQKWIDDQLVYKIAKDNISDKDKIEEMVENYRKTLITYTYLEDLLQENLSKKISDEELQKYYDENKKKLVLSSNLVKGVYLKIPVNAPQKEELQKYYRSTSDDAKEYIEKYSLRNTVDYNYFYDEWKDFREVLSKLPMSIPNTRQFLQSHKSIELSDSAFVYLVNISDYKLIGTIPPFDYAKSQIKDLIVNNRKENYIRTLEKDLYQKAVEEKNIKYYKK